MKYVREKLEVSEDALHNWSNYNEKHEIYAVSHTILWDYEYKCPYKGDAVKEKRRCYLHLYFNSEKASNDAKRMNHYLTQLRIELEKKQERPEHEKDYRKYFTVKDTPVRGRIVVPIDDAIQKATRGYGYFALLSNEMKDPIDALDLYRNKDLVEKAFGNLKERLNFKRTLVSSESSLNGKVFVEFIALIYLSYIKKKMQGHNLFSQWTLQGLLDELDVIECFETPGYSPIIGEMTKRQLDIYIAMGVEPPSL